MEMTIIFAVIGVFVGCFIGIKVLRLLGKGEEYVDTKVALATSIAKIDASVARTKKLEAVKKRYPKGLVSQEKFDDFLESMEMAD